MQLTIFPRGTTSYFFYSYNTYFISSRGLCPKRIIYQYKRHVLYSHDIFKINSTYNSKLFSMVHGTTGGHRAEGNAEISLALR